jgi:HSP20 family protein
MKLTVLKISVVALAILAIVEAAILLGLHAPFIPQTEDQDAGATKFEVLDDPRSRASMLTPNGSPLGSLSSPRVSGAASVDPFAEIERMRREMDEQMREMMQHARAGTGTGIVTTLPTTLQHEVSAISLKEKDDRYVCSLRANGVDEDSVHITVEGNALTISGKRTLEQTQEHQGRIVAHVRSTEQFARSTELPGPVKASCMRTSLDDGVLTIELPKASGASEMVPLD